MLELSAKGTKKPPEGGLNPVDTVKGIVADQAFLAQAEHQAFADTCLPANNGQGPAAAPALA